MRRPFFYSLPPAGQKLPFSKIWDCLSKTSNPPDLDLLEPVRKYLGTKYVLFLNSGRSSLWLLLKALMQINPAKREVVIPAYACPAVASAVLKAGLMPILCDNNLQDFGLDIDHLKEKITNKTLAVIVVHLFGYPANVKEVQDTCNQLNIFMIEDAAQAFGNTSFGSSKEKLGMIGDGGFFSFRRGKPISILHGGLLVTQSLEIFTQAQKIYRSLNGSDRLANLKYVLSLTSYMVFSNPYLYWIPQHIPSLHLGETIFEPEFRPTSGLSFTASLLDEMIESIEEEKQIRRYHANWFSSQLNSIPDLQLPRNPDFPFLRFPVLVINRTLRDKILKELTLQGTGAGQFYPCPLNELPGLKDILKDSNSYPNSKEISDRLITLPVHSRVSTSDLKKIVQIIKKSVY